MIEFRAVTKRYPDGTVAVDEFDLVIESRQITVLVGSSGSGKTTLLRMINRMVDPSAGMIEIDGNDIATASRWRCAAVDRLRDAELRSAAAPQGDRQRRDRPAPERGAKKDAHAHALELMDVVGLDRALATALPESALRRSAAARRGGAWPGGRPQHPAHGRAVRRRRPHRARRTAAGDPAIQRELGEDDRVRHARHRRGVPARRPRRHPRHGRPHRPAGHARGDPGAPADDFVAEFIGSDRGKRRLVVRETGEGDDRVLVDAGGYPVGVISARRAARRRRPSPKSRSISNKTDQAGDA